MFCIMPTILAQLEVDQETAGELFLLHLKYDFSAPVKIKATSLENSFCEKNIPGHLQRIKMDCYAGKRHLSKIGNIC